MKLSESMELELRDRLDRLDASQQEDPAFVDLPRIDRYWIAAFFIVALIAVASINL